MLLLVATLWERWFLTPMKTAIPASGSLWQVWRRSLDGPSHRNASRRGILAHRANRHSRMALVLWIIGFSGKRCGVFALATQSMTRWASAHFSPSLRVKR